MYVSTTQNSAHTVCSTVSIGRLVRDADSGLRTRDANCTRGYHLNKRLMRLRPPLPPPNKLLFMANRSKCAKDSQEHEMSFIRCILQPLQSYLVWLGLAWLCLFEFKRIVYGDLSVNIVVRFPFKFFFVFWISFLPWVCKENRSVVAVSATRLIATKHSSNA